MTLLIAGGAMVLGGLIYVFFRPTRPLFLRWLDTLGCFDTIDAVRSMAEPISSVLPISLVYSLPQGLWAFTYAMIIIALWGGSIPQSRIGILWIASIPLVTYGHEGLQGAGAIAGTCCQVDLILSSVGILLGSVSGWIRRI